jgi:short-subunit dehydrogenase
MDTPKGRKRVAKGFQNAKLTGNDVARAALKAINKNKGLVIVGNEGKFMDVLQRISRRLFERLILKVI